jgi:hypothetical protein
MLVDGFYLGKPCRSREGIAVELQLLPPPPSPGGKTAALLLYSPEPRSWLCWELYTPHKSER